MITARIKRTYKVSEQIELRVNDHIDQIKNSIHSIIKDNGEKYIEVRTDNDYVFEAFDFKEKD